MAAPITTEFNDSTASSDPRPRFAIGHMGISAADVPKLTRFYAGLGMRQVVDTGNFAILELRGGTHLILQSGPGGGNDLDLIVDDIDDVHADMEAVGANPGPITRGHPHDRFLATDPEGNRLFVSSNHAMGPV